MKLLIIILMAVSCATSNQATTPIKPNESVNTEPRQKPDDTQTTSNLVLFSARTQDVNKYPWLSKSIDCAHKIINSDLFRNQIKAIKQFDYAPTTTNGAMVLDRLNTAKTVSVRMYYKRFGSAIAYTYYDAAEIYLNTKWKRPISEIVNTLVHESTHTVGYSHGDNYAAGKQNSIPYKLGDVAESVAKELCK